MGARDDGHREITRAAVNGNPVTPLAYLVVAGEYDDRQVLCACADESAAAERATRWNLANHPSEYDAARVEPVEFVPARGAEMATPPRIIQAELEAGG
jgi:hypothetical protein